MLNACRPVKRRPLLRCGAAFLGTMMYACASTPVAPDQPRLEAGVWGGDGVALTVTADGARIEFDCAFGEITETPRLEADGGFDFGGVFVQEHAGPIQQDEVPNRQPARYVGRLVGKTLTFDVVLLASNERRGSFAATYNMTPRVRKCR